MKVEGVVRADHQLCVAETVHKMLERGLVKDQGVVEKLTRLFGGSMSCSGTDRPVVLCVDHHLPVAVVHRRHAGPAGGGR